MNFFDRQDQARRSTKLLVVYFSIAVAAIILAVYVAALVVFNGSNTRQRRQQEIGLTLWNPRLFVIAAGGTLAVILGGSFFKTAQLSAGGSAVAESLDGRLLDHNTDDPHERKLLNVVEEMAIASGVPTPKVYLLDHESGINAFAAGHDPGDAAIGVTRGCITALTRDELQGVIGHEFSHILNGDMRLNLRLMGVIFGIMCLAVIGRTLLRTRGGSRDRNPLPLFGLALLLLGWVGVFFAQLIQAAVSRQREFLADASAVQFTRNPDGLAGALKKIGAAAAGSQIDSEHATEASHMFFGNPLQSSFLNAFATHPPLAERIRAIDPNWDGNFPTPDSRDVMQEIPARATKSRGTFPPIIPGFPVAAAGLASAPPVGIANILPSIGNPTPLHLRYAVEFRESLPTELRAAAQSPSDAMAVLFAMLLSTDESMRASQLERLAQRTESKIFLRLKSLEPQVAAITQRTRLPLVNLVLPALRRLRPAEFQQFNQTLTWLIESDRQIDLFEFALQKIIRRQFELQLGEQRPTPTQFYSTAPLVGDVAVLLSALAYVGQNDPSAIAQAFASGAPYARIKEARLELLPREKSGLAEINRALDRLALAVPQIKKNLLEACIRVVAADDVVQETEAELLRAMAETLDCPIPPFVVET